MALKRRTKVNESFSMASMTDVIFLLLIFFMVTSTVVIPNAIKVTLPQAQKQTAAKPLTRVTIDANLNYYVAFGNQREKQVSFEEITPFLQDSYAHTNYLAKHVLYNQYHYVRLPATFQLYLVLPLDSHQHIHHNVPVLLE